MKLMKSLYSLPLLMAGAMAQMDGSTTYMPPASTEAPVETEAPSTTMLPETTEATTTTMAPSTTVEEVEECEEYHRSWAGEISMYNTEETYPHNSCVRWFITAPEGMIVHLQPTMMDIETHSDCIWDSLTVEENDEEIYQYCSNDMSHIDSTGNMLTLTFRSDASVARDGFEMEVDFTMPCTEETIYSAGSIDFHTTDAYESSQCRIWKIVAPESKAIRLTPEEMNIESHSECNWDALNILEDGSSIHEYCGYDMTVIESTTNELTLKFTSDSSVQRYGFDLNIEFFIPCINQDVRYAGMIDFTDDDGNYPHSICRTWTIHAPETRNIKLTPSVMDIEEHSECIWDSLTVMENDMSVHTYCGGDMTVVQSEGNMVVLKFVSDGSVNAAGFEMNVEFEKICYTNYINPTQWSTEWINFHFPEESYPHDSCMIWHINALPNRMIKLTPTTMDIEQPSSWQNDECVWDSISVMENGEELHRYCGNDMTMVQSSGSSITVTFHSDRSVAQEGFHIAVDVERICEYREYNNQYSGSIALAGYGNHECYVWKIHAPEHKVITIDPQAMDLEYSWFCSYDKLKIYDGHSKYADLLHTYCGMDEHTSMSTGNALYLRFESDESITDNGFWVDFNVIDAPIPCLHTEFALTSELDLLMGNVNGYENRLCETWLIHSVTGEPVHVDITTMDVEDHWNCDYDRVEIYDGISEHCPLIHTYCGDDDFTPVSAESGHAFIKFVTDGSVTTDGWSMLLHTHRPEPQLVNEHGHIMNRFGNGIPMCAAVDDFTVGHEVFMTDCLRTDMNHFNTQWHYCEETKMIYSICGHYCWEVADHYDHASTIIQITDECAFPSYNNRFIYLKEIGQIAMADHRFGHKCINFDIHSHNILHVDACHEQNTFGLIPEV